MIICLQTKINCINVPTISSRSVEENNCLFYFVVKISRKKIMMSKSKRLGTKYGKIILLLLIHLPP